MSDRESPGQAEAEAALRELSVGLNNDAAAAARAYRERTFDYYQPIYASQGYCTARSPESRMCTKKAGHDDPLHPGHHAEAGPRNRMEVVEEWM